MATINYDAEIILNGVGYFVKPNSYSVKQHRISHSKYRADGGLAYTDSGVGKRTWAMTILAVNELKKYDGSIVTTTGQQFRDALRSAFTASAGTTYTYTDPFNTPFTVHFDGYEEFVLNIHSQIIALASGGTIGASYECHISLLEA